MKNYFLRFLAPLRLCGEIILTQRPQRITQRSSRKIHHGTLHHCITELNNLQLGKTKQELFLADTGKEDCCFSIGTGTFQVDHFPFPKTFVFHLHTGLDIIAGGARWCRAGWQVVEYLGRYTHKAAISNHRIKKISDDGVTFRWRDYRDNREKIMQLSGTEFLRRFCQHILPRRFVRIRHYGLLSTSHRDDLRRLQSGFGIIVPERIEKKNWKEICREHLKYDPDLCPHCGKGTMVTIERLLPGRSPPIDPMKIKEVYIKID